MRQPILKVIAGLIAGLAVLPLGSAQADDEGDRDQLYRVTDINGPNTCLPPAFGFPRTRAGEFFASAINDKGDVTGDLTCTSSATPFLYSAKTGQISLFAFKSEAAAINRKGQITGWTVAFGPPEAFLLNTATSTKISIGQGFGFGINDKGAVVGQLLTPQHAFEYTPAGSLVDLDARLGGQGSVATGINDRGHIIGQSTALGAFLLRSSGVRQLGVLDRGSSTLPAAINLYDEVVGCSTLSNGVVHAFVFFEGRIFDLGQPSGLTYSCALSVNTTGEIVGAAQATAPQFIGIPPLLISLARPSCGTRTRAISTN